jgi:hypothetical protein
MEIDDTIHSLVTTTSVASSDKALVVPTTLTLVPLEE